MKNVYLACNNEGGVISVAHGNNFKEVYDDIVGSNNAEFLVELTDGNVKEIVEMYNCIKEGLVD